MSTLDKPAPSRKKIALLWLLFIGILWFGFDRYMAHVTGQRQGKLLYSSDSTLVIQRDASGHYVLPGKINGHDVRFLIDTGATRMSIPAETAAHLQIEPRHAVQVTTANGMATGYTATINEMMLGHFMLVNIDAVLSPGMHANDDILLGMNVLRFFNFSQVDDKLFLRPAEDN